MNIETLQATLLTLAESSANELLSHNPEALRRLSQLDGKVISIQLQSPTLQLSIQPHVNGLQLEQIIREDADVALTGTPSDFLRLLTSQEKSDALFGKSIQISGDSALATRFSQILIDAGMDWEGMLAGIIGDLPAHQLGNYLRWKVGFYLNAGSSLITNLEEYLKEEIRLLPTQPEVNHFNRQVSQLREDTDRIQARIERLQQQTG